MVHPGQQPPSDARLENLLEVERELEARTRDAEHRAKARIEAAREAARRLDGELRDATEGHAGREEQQDLEAHAARLARIASESETRLARLASAASSQVERLALLAYAEVISGGGSP